MPTKPFDFAINLEEVKRLFFDRDIARADDKATQATLSRIGAYIQTTAKRSLRRRKKSSQPGRPPSTHTEGKQNLKFILFAYQPADRSVIVGPVRLNTRVNVAQLMEFGGAVHTQRDSVGRVKSRKAARYRPRPFVGPAGEKEAPKAPSIYADMVARHARKLV